MTTTHYQDDLTADELSTEQLVYIASHSQTKAVQEAFKKLEFLVRLSHTQEEIEMLSQNIPEYKMRVGIPAHNTTNEKTYDYVRVNVQGDIVEVTHDNYRVVGRLRESKENIFYMGAIK